MIASAHSLLISRIGTDPALHDGYPAGRAEDVGWYYLGGTVGFRVPMEA